MSCTSRRVKKHIYMYNILVCICWTFKDPNIVWRFWSTSENKHRYSTAIARSAAAPRARWRSCTVNIMWSHQSVTVKWHSTILSVCSRTVGDRHWSVTVVSPEPPGGHDSCHTGNDETQDGGNQDEEGPALVLFLVVFNPSEVVQSFCVKNNQTHCTEKRWK